MKHLYKIFTIIILASCIVSCKLFSSKNKGEILLPNVSGKAGEIVVVLDKNSWEGAIGTDVRNVLAADCPYLPQREPLYSIVNISPNSFTDMFKIHRNLLIFNIKNDLQHNSIIFKSNTWAKPQCVIQINAINHEEAAKLFNDNKEKILNTIEQAERDRVIANSIKYEDVALGKIVTKMIGGSPHFPMGYKLMKETKDFIWIQNDRQFSFQGIFIYKYPAKKTDNFTKENIIYHRNQFLKENVPGMRNNSYMITSNYIKPTVKFIKFRGREFAETRGFWEVFNDYMGGPFVSHSFYSPDSKYIIVLEAFVYNPKSEKREYLRQVESILYSFEWGKNKKNSDK